MEILGILFRDSDTVYNIVFTGIPPVSVKTNILRKACIITLKQDLQLMHRVLVMYQMHHKIDLLTYIGK